MGEIAVIIPVYNVESYLKRCLDSILSQSFQHFRIFLVDDGSKDSSGKICDEYAEKDSRITVFHQENKGQAAARNSAIDYVLENTDCEYFTFIDSDDWIHPQFLEILMSAFSNPDVKISGCSYLPIDQITENEIIENFDIGIQSAEEYWVRIGNNAPWGRIYQRETLQKFRFPEGIICEDAFWSYKVVFSQSLIAYTDEKLYYYFTNVTGTMNSKWSLRRLTEHEAQAEQYNYFKSTKSDPCTLSTFHKYLYFLILALLNLKKYYPEEKSVYAEVRVELKQLLKEKKPFLYIKAGNSLYYEAVVKSLHDMLTDVVYIKKIFGNNLFFTSVIKFYILRLFTCHKNHIKKVQGFSAVYKEIHPFMFEINRKARKLRNNLKEHISKK